MKAEAEDISVEAEVVDDKAHHKARHKKGFENYILYYSLEIIELMLSICSTRDLLILVVQFCVNFLLSQRGLLFIIVKK